MKVVRGQRYSGEGGSRTGGELVVAAVLGLLGSDYLERIGKFLKTKDLTYGKSTCSLVFFGTKATAKNLIDRRYS